MGSMSASQITQEMQKVEQALVNIIGIKPAYMRPPYLETSGQFLPTLKGLGYKVITDDIDTGDWNKNTPAQSEQLFTKAGATGNGHIPLMHEVYPGTVDTLTPWLINWAKTNNLSIVTVGKLTRPIHYRSSLTYNTPAECLGDPDGMYQTGNWTSNGATSC
jgi:peptidoglycan/xylan/chitin deacetylase (PgdA/CDA1 family)